MFQHPPRKPWLYNGPSRRLEDCGKRTLFSERLRAAGFTEEQLIDVDKALHDLCRDCWDADGDCLCGNDE